RSTSGRETVSGAAPFTMARLLASQPPWDSSPCWPLIRAQLGLAAAPDMFNVDVSEFSRYTSRTLDPPLKYTAVSRSPWRACSRRCTDSDAVGSPRLDTSAPGHRATRYLRSSRRR